MTKVLVLYYSSWAHVEQMAEACAVGVRSEDATCDVKRLSETVPDDVAKQSCYKLEQAAPVASPEDMADYDAIIFGTPTRFGMMSAQMKTFLDQAGALWQNGSLVGKIGSVITSSGTQHGGQVSKILSFHVSLLHFGMVLVGLPYSFAGLSGVGEVKGGTPYGASTIPDADGSRMPSEIELDGARFQGAHVAKLSKKLSN